MKRLACLLLITLPVTLAHAAPPAVHLLVELRWVEMPLSPAAQAGVRDGAVVVGTAGAVSPRGAGVVAATAGSAPPSTERLLVGNGERAALRITTREPLQWVDAVADLTPQGQVRGIYARPLTRDREAVRHVSVAPSWAGGRAPVRVSLQVEDDGQALATTLDLPLARWHTVARTGAGTPAPVRGTVSSGDAAARAERELQLRVSIPPQP